MAWDASLVGTRLTRAPAAGSIAGLRRRSLPWALAGATVLMALAGCGSQSLRDPVLSNLVSVLSSKDCVSQPVRMLTPRQTPATPVRFAQLATERASIVCRPTGSAVVYLSFRSHRELRAALGRYRRAIRGDVCAVGRSVFFYASLYDPAAAYYMADSCYRMSGYWLPSGQPVSASL
jgi:hypothetical protein